METKKAMISKNKWLLTKLSSINLKNNNVPTNNMYILYNIIFQYLIVALRFLNKIIHLKFLIAFIIFIQVCFLISMTDIFTAYSVPYYHHIVR